MDKKNLRPPMKSTNEPQRLFSDKFRKYLKPGEIQYAVVFKRLQSVVLYGVICFSLIGKLKLGELSTLAFDN